MLYKVDLINEVVLLIDKELKVVDAFPANGPTERTCEHPVSYYTYRSLVVPPGVCALCGVGPEDLEKHCVSSGGCHAFTAGSPPSVPQEHLAENRSLPLTVLTYDELRFYLEADNLFPAQDIQKTLVV